MSARSAGELPRTDDRIATGIAPTADRRGIRRVIQQDIVAGFRR